MKKESGATGAKGDTDSNGLISDSRVNGWRLGSNWFNAVQQTRKGRAVPKFRAITYTCYMERRLASAADLKKKRKAFEERHRIILVK